MSDHYSREISIFLAAIETEGTEELRAYLNDACGDDRRLRADVEALLVAHLKDNSFLEHPAAALDRTVDLNQRALDAGLAATFGADAAVVVGHAGHSVLKSLSKKLHNVPKVTLREGAEVEDKVVQLGSKEFSTKQADSRYQLHGEIARGGMGAIIKGRDTDLGRDLAIKVLLDVHKDKPDMLQRFVEEAQIGGQLQHPGIVPVYELGQFADQRPFFSMKLVKGETLAALISKRKDAHEDQPKLLGIFEHVCQTMAYAHNKGVVHRDLKPANIMVGAFGEVQVMDWGLSKVLNGGGIHDERKSLDKHRDVSVIQTRRRAGSDAPGEVGSNTQIGSVMGTPAYMPPEQALGEIDRLDERADVFGLGAILAEILTGKPPYVADDATQIFRMASRGKLDDCFARLAASGTEAELIELAKSALSPEPDDRLRNAGELSAGITKHLEGVQERLKQTELARVEAQARSVEERRRRKLYVAIAGMLVVFALSAAALFYERAERQTELAKKETEVRLEKEHSEQLVMLETVSRLTAASRETRMHMPTQSALLALEAAKVSREYDGTIEPTALEAVLNSTIELNGPPLDCGDVVNCVAISPNNRWLVTAVGAVGVGLAKVWDLKIGETPQMVRVLRAHREVPFNGIHTMKFLDDNHVITLASKEGTASLWDLSNPSVSVQVFGGHDADYIATKLLISPDGHWLAIGSDDNIARLWDLKAEEPAKSCIELRGHSDQVTTFSFSGDGRWLATGSGRLANMSRNGKDKTVRVWDLNDPSQPKFVLKSGPKDSEPSFGPISLAFDPMSRWLVASGDLPQVWDLASANPNDTSLLLEQHLGGANKVAFSPNGKLLATAGREVNLWRWTDDGISMQPLYIGNHNDGLTNMEFSPDGKWLASTTWDSNGRLWDVTSDNVRDSMTILRGHENLVFDLEFSPDSSFMLTSSRDRTVRRWELSGSSPISDRILKLPKPIGAIEFTPDMSWLIAACEGEIRLWKFDTGRAIGPPLVLEGFRQAGRYGMYGMQISPDGRWLAAITDTEVRVWDLQNEIERLPGSRRDLVGHTQQIRFFAFDPHGRWLATASKDKTVRVWDLSADDPSASVIVLDHQGVDASLIAISPDSKWLAAIAVLPRDETSDYSNCVIRLWSLPQVLATPESNTPPAHVIKTKPNEDCAVSLGFSPDSQRLTASTSSGKLIVVDLASDQIENAHWTMGKAQKPTAVFRVTPNNKTAITFGQVGKVGLWNIENPSNGEVKELPEGHTDLGEKLSMDREARRLVTGGEDKTARVWDTRDPDAPPLVLRAHETNVKSVAMSLDGRWVVTGSGNTLRIWDLDVEAVLARAKRIAGRELTPAEREQYNLSDPSN